ncbi:MAG: hypothetical protein H6807_09335 [Planctomycetes bacterium]|nr:hypothetical protein [Planctomycetota bacterium]
MARRPNQIQDALEQAMAEVSRDIMMRAIASTPRDMSLGDFIDAMDRTSFAAEFRALDLAGLQAALGQSAPRGARGRGRRLGAAKKAGRKAGGRQKGYSTRTQSGREAIDNAVSEALQASAEPVRAEGLKQVVAASPAQIRQSLARLIEAGKVAKKGEKRATEYRWKARK